MLPISIPMPTLPSGFVSILLSRLISALCEEAFRQGYERVGLIVEPNNTKAQTLYSSVGFRCVGERPFFSHMMWHMQIEQNFSGDKFA